MQTARLKHLDLFSGIGGFAYAIDQVWPNVEHTFCEIDPFCQKVLKKHWPDSKIYEDINELNGITEGEQKKEKELWDSKTATTENIYWGGVHTKYDLLTAGVPCQPASQAGRRRGKEDDRWLWPQTFTTIKLTQPTWVILENVRGLITLERGMVFKELLFTLEGLGYETVPIIIPAVSVNAPHRRDRIWFVAHSSGKRLEGEVWKKQSGNSRRLATQDRRESKPWNKNWIEVATKFCSLDDGLPVELDGFKLSKAGSRREQLKAYGNAIVPQVAIEILKAIPLD